eukprot:1600156-Rhodomonas_salina.1
MRASLSSRMGLTMRAAVISGEQQKRASSDPLPRNSSPPPTSRCEKSTCSVPCVSAMLPVSWIRSSSSEIGFRPALALSLRPLSRPASPTHTRQERMQSSARASNAWRGGGGERTPVDFVFEDGADEPYGADRLVEGEVGEALE